MCVEMVMLRCWIVRPNMTAMLQTLFPLWQSIASCHAALDNLDNEIRHGCNWLQSVSRRSMKSSAQKASFLLMTVVFNLECDIHQLTSLALCAGGKAAYPSSVLMNAIPAMVAGVSRRVMVVPAKNGEVAL